MSKPTLSHITLCTVIETQSESELQSGIESVRNVSKPPSLYNEDIYISEKELDETNIVYSNDDAELPDRGEDYTAISADVTDENDIHIHSYIEEDNLDQVLPNHQQMLTSGNEVDIRFIKIAFEQDEAFRDVLESIEFIEFTNDSAEVDVLNYVKDGYDITLSKYPEETTISVVEPNVKSEEPSEFEERVRSTIDMTDQYVSEELL